jgi:hypothetical protein
MCFEIAPLVVAVRSGALQRVAILVGPSSCKPLRSETLTFIPRGTGVSQGRGGQEEMALCEGRVSLGYSVSSAQPGPFLCGRAPIGFRGSAE